MHCPLPDVIGRGWGECCLATQKNNWFLGSAHQFYAFLNLFCIAKKKEKKETLLSTTD